eukprot:6173503-Pleurochrysis_carterae.AAC.1
MVASEFVYGRVRIRQESLGRAGVGRAGRACDADAQAAGAAADALGHLGAAAAAERRAEPPRGGRARAGEGQRGRNMHTTRAHTRTRRARTHAHDARAHTHREGERRGGERESERAEPSLGARARQARERGRKRRRAGWGGGMWGEREGEPQRVRGEGERGEREASGAAWRPRHVTRRTSRAVSDCSSLLPPPPAACLSLSAVFCRLLLLSYLALRRAVSHSQFCRSRRAWQSVTLQCHTHPPERFAAWETSESGCESEKLPSPRKRPFSGRPFE